MIGRNSAIIIEITFEGKSPYEIMAEKMKCRKSLEAGIMTTFSWKTL
jgi:hypothetical protein